MGLRMWMPADWLRDLFSTDGGQVICTHKNDTLLLRTGGLEEVFNRMLNALELLGWRQRDPLLLLKPDTPFPSFAASRRLCRTMNLRFDFPYGFPTVRLRLLLSFAIAP